MNTLKPAQSIESFCDPSITRVYHLSHIDLDGYGSQFVTRAVFPEIYFENSDYGDGILIKFAQLVELYRRHTELDAETRPQALFLITDLNLTPALAKAISEALAPFGDRVSLLLLDHHGTGAEVAKRNDWYHLDTEWCSVMLTFRRFEPLIPCAHYVFLENFARHVNAVDLWKTDEPEFKAANLLAALVHDLRDFIPESLSDLAREYRFHMIANVIRQVQSGGTLRALEQSVLTVRESFLLAQRIPASVVMDEDCALQDKYFTLVVETILNTWSSEVVEFSHEGLKGAILYGYPKGIFQNVSNLLLHRRKDVDFFVNLTPNGYLSFRSVGVNVSSIAAQYFSGGGHPCASGGRIPGTFKQKEDAVAVFMAQFEKKKTPAKRTA